MGEEKGHGTKGTYLTQLLEPGVISLIVHLELT